VRYLLHLKHDLTIDASLKLLLDGSWRVLANTWLRVLRISPVRQLSKCVLCRCCTSQRLCSIGSPFSITGCQIADFINLCTHSIFNIWCDKRDVNVTIIGVGWWQGRNIEKCNQERGRTHFRCFRHSVG